MEMRDCDTCKHEDIHGRCVATSFGDCLPQDYRPLWERAINCHTCKHMPISGDCAAPNDKPCWTASGYDQWELRDGEGEDE